MQTCAKCRGGNFDEFIKVQHLEDLGGIVVRLLGAVIVFRCPECGFSQIAIPDMQGLVKAAAMARALNPARMSGKEIRFMRRALDMTKRSSQSKWRWMSQRFQDGKTTAKGLAGSQRKHSGRMCVLCLAERLGYLMILRT